MTQYFVGPSLLGENVPVYLTARYDAIVSMQCSWSSPWAFLTILYTLRFLSSGNLGQAVNYGAWRDCGTLPSDAIAKLYVT